MELVFLLILLPKYGKEAGQQCTYLLLLPGLHQQTTVFEIPTLIFVYSVSEK
jgi:hypothetical protein